ncbi:MAG: glycosyltransferase [Bacteroidetes bacterium]|nr:glycosyltransferase [Bacteroidota bacterium]
MFIIIGTAIVLFFPYAILIGYYYKAWKKIPMPDFFPSSQILSAKISVIIPARNEEKNISQCIQSLLKQTYPKDLFEVLIVDDHSTDNTWNILQQFLLVEKNIIPIKLADFVSTDIKAYKKFAIETAVNHANGELIITTDADCVFDERWLETIASFHNSANAKFIAAPVKINANNSFLSIFQTLDFITLQGITGASVYKRFHSMCNGANLAYEKNVFFEVNGFRGIDNIPSGDDMLLMHKIYTKYPEQVFFLKNKKAIVTTQPERTWKRFFNQRIRWSSKADKYDDKRIFRILFFVYVINAFLVALLLLSFFNLMYLLVFLILLSAKTIIEFSFVRAVSLFFGQQKLMVYFPFLQPFHILYTVVIGWLGKFGSYDWKGRIS